MEAPRRLVDDVLTMQRALWTACEYSTIPLNLPSDGEPKESRPTIKVDRTVHKFVCESVLAESTPEYHRIVVTARETTGGRVGDMGSSEVRVFADGHFDI